MKLLQIDHIDWQSDHLFQLSLTEPIDTFIRPGQYAVMRLPQLGLQSYFAFSSIPDEPASFLLKDDGSAAAILSEAKHGDPLELVSVGGEGFDLSGTHSIQNGIEVIEPNPTDVVVRFFSMGSGIGPIRSVLRYALEKHWHERSIELWHSAYSWADVPYKDDISRWHDNGKVQFIGCYDRSDRYRNAVEELIFRSPDLSKSVIFWIGSDRFGEALLDASSKLGIDLKNFRTNHKGI